MNYKDKLGKGFVFFILSIVSASTLYPLVFMFINSFKERTEYSLNRYGLPNEIYVGNLTELINNFFILNSFFNSAFVSIVTVTVSVSLAALASYAFAKTEFRGRKKLFFFVIAFMMVPGQVLLIPIYVMFSNMGLVNNFLSVIIVYIAMTLPFGIFLLTVNFRGIPTEVIESAKLDGATFLRIFTFIVIPMGKPAMMTLAILNFLTVWNELLLSMMLLNHETKRLLTVTVASIATRYNTNMPLMMTGLLLSILPAITIYIIFSKYLLKGITVGAVK